jgi:hypothetical protein
VSSYGSQWKLLHPGWLCLARCEWPGQLGWGDLPLCCPLRRCPGCRLRCLAFLLGYAMPAMSWAQRCGGRACWQQRQHGTLMLCPPSASLPSAAPADAQQQSRIRPASCARCCSQQPWSASGVWPVRCFSLLLDSFSGRLAIVDVSERASPLCVKIVSYSTRRLCCALIQPET